MGKIVIANAIGIITFILSIYVNTLINRKNNLIGWIYINILDSIAYLLLNCFQGFIATIYFGIHKIIIVILHKEEKIVQTKTEAVILGIPFLIIGIVLSKSEGIIALLGGILNFFNSMLFIIKKDETRLKADLTMDIGYILYDLRYINIVSAIKYVIEIVIYIINIYRVKKNGEVKYYEDMTNVEKNWRNKNGKINNSKTRANRI